MIKIHFKLPILIESDKKLIAVFSANGLDSAIAKAEFNLKDTYFSIDSKGEGWGYYSKLEYFSPLITKKRWYKKEIIELHNKFVKNKNDKFIGRSLSSKTLPKVIHEIVAFSANR
ncbi:hypothetical protein [Pelagibaculum spongiae]|uniref:Uncharacterized protein n=1 Tax=Pelagibaculum spongiae TaxID=2080658 RepID=A0A2V1H1P2_9GAMM|nr:hypothetical protein [Pelagibaculum spongiae]PVZ70352.1 hypothetical protein DC094_07090 [Pelagibaculum spongiae]